MTAPKIGEDRESKGWMITLGNENFWAQKKVLVTGGASGIGEACVKAFASTHACVVAADIDEVRLDELAASDNVEKWCVDLSDTEKLDELALDVDILVNCAGIQHVSPVEEFPPDRWRFIHKLMVEAPFLLTRASLGHMYDKEWGRVINVSSVHGLIASPYKSAYVAAKHALEGFSKTVALEGAAHGVTSNCINPGYVRTALVDKQIKDQARVHNISEQEVIEKVFLESSAIKRLVEPDEVAAMVLWLCQPEAAMVTGTSMAMDGGWTAH